LRRDLGDFQTPPALVAAVLDELGPIGRRWPRVLEPTCGRGHFLAGLVSRPTPPRELIGIEIQDVHAAAARAIGDARPPNAAASRASVSVTIVTRSLFDLDLSRDLVWRHRGPLLVVGNPPWVTSAALGVLASENLPRKWNVKGAVGLDSRTGAANFDLAEAVWLKLIDELANEGDPVTIALLCKASVARRVLEHAERRSLPIARARLSHIEAKRWFGAEVEACLFRLTLRGSPGAGRRVRRVPVFARLGAAAPAFEMGFARGRLVADFTNYKRWMFADGACHLTWRQGLKHDVAAVMELAGAPGDRGLSRRWRNKQGETVDVEAAHVYPLLKGSDLARAELPAVPPYQRAVIVTQTRIGQDTRPLEQTAPRLWAYLAAHAPAFARRKSSIYRGQPPFALFGIGPYSFAPYKVVVSGLHKTARFHAVGPDQGRPVMLDDTGYFVPCASPEQAALVTAILDEEATRGFLRSLVFPAAKRPITKALLQRLDLHAIADRADRGALLARAETIRCRLIAASNDGRRVPD
jgi:hypothetical protein